MNYPALQDIYDLTTEELKDIENMLRQNLNGQEELLETVQLEIEQRKTLQFFAKLCETDNPYTKKISSFNDQFIRLASEAIRKNQSIAPEKQQNYPPKIMKSEIHKPEYKQENKPSQLTSYCLEEQEFNVSTDHKQIENDSKSETDKKSFMSQDLKKTDNISVTTIRSSSKESKTQSISRSTQKMGIGFHKKKKNKMAEIIQNTLARTKVDTVITIKRGGAQSPVKNKYDKKYHIPGEKHENLELKSKPPSKPTPQSKQKTNEPIKSNKKVDSEKIKKTKDVINRTKQQNKKGSSVKLPKLNPYNDLVAMVKKEEEQKRIRTQKMLQQKKISQEETLPYLTQKRIKGEEIIAQQEFTDKDNEEPIMEDIEVKVDEKQYQSRQSEQSIKQEIEGEVPVILQEECEESMSPTKVRGNLQEKAESIADHIDENNKDGNKKDGNKRDQDRCCNMEGNHIESEQKVDQGQIVVDKKKRDQFGEETKQSSQSICSQQKQQNSQSQRTIQTPQSPHIKEEQTNKSQKIPSQNNDIDYTKKLLQQIQQQQKDQYYFFNQSQELPPEVDKETEHIIKIEIQQKREEKQEVNDKIYSEQYWAHIREEAELKIKRFRQQKQIQKLTEFADIQKDQQQSSVKQNSEPTGSQMSSTAEKFNQEIQKKKEQLQSMKKKLKNKNKQLENKKNTKPSIPKIVYAKPEFDYLQIYPSFNHIFSIMYLKPIHQATSDIPNIMREIKTLFINHVQHFEHNKTFFQPALFLPFDHHGSFQINDPKQLLLHAQNTYVDLKVMVSRIENFNKNISGTIQNNEQKRYFRVVKSKQQVYDIITTSFMRNMGWKELPHGSGLRTTWNLFWSWSKPDIDMNKLLIWQRINHFPFNKNLSRKDLLYKNLEHFKKTYKVSMNFLPVTYNLPKQFSQLSIKFHEEEMLNKDTNYWIMKPIGKSRGRGIKVISSLSELNYIDNIVVQKYISNPLLLDGYKFDMRIYVLVTSFHPLEAFVYRQGFARLSTQKFSLNVNSIKNTFIHLTNFSINKNNIQANSNFIGGSKISLKTLKDKLTKMGYSFSDIWKQIHQIIIKSLLGCSISVPSFPSAFQLFGYDVMVDDKGHCDLIEINSSPSLERSFIIDEIIKQNLIDDAMEIVNPPQFDKKSLLDVLSERIQLLVDGKKISKEDDLIGLARILKYKPIRKVGEIPQKMGLFEMVAPSQSSRQLEKLIKGKSCANNPMNID